jgi:plasmid stabilization system protein ParE
MPPFAVEVHPLAADEAEAAERWYRERNETAATRFRRELDRAVTLIAERPEAAPSYVGNTRRFLLRRFPFFVYRPQSACPESPLHTLDEDRTTGITAEMTTGIRTTDVGALHGENRSLVALKTCSLTLVSLMPASVRPGCASLTP